MNKVILGDCFELFKDIEDSSIDLVLSDWPYNTTGLDWDKDFDYKKAFDECLRIIKPNKPIVLFSAEPFSSFLITYGIKKFKYRWTWMKKRPGGFMNAKKRPLKVTEDIIVFNTNIYNPQDLIEINANRNNSDSKMFDKKAPCKGVAKTTISSSSKLEDRNSKEYFQKYTNYPRDILIFGLDEKEKLHPTQKPVELLRYLIRTYSNPGDLILDNCGGVFSTPIACIKEQRNYIAFEKNIEYFNIGLNRINKIS